MEYEQKVEIINLYLETYEEKFKEQSALGWEVVSTTINTTDYGDQMVITFKRNKQLKFYNRLLDLNNKLDKTKQLIKNYKEENNEIIKKKKPYAIIYEIIKWMIFILIFFMLLTVPFNIFYLTKKFEWKIVFRVIIYTIFSIGLFIIQRTFKRYMNRFINETKNDKIIKELNNQLKYLISEANKLNKNQLGEV